MIKNLQRFFHTDTRLGKRIFIIIFYVVFWIIFYGSLSLISEDAFIGYENFAPLLLFYIFIFVPFLSFVFIHYINKNILIKHIYIYNIFFIILALILFLYIDLLKSMPHWFNF